MDKLGRYEFLDVYMMAYDLINYDRTYKTCGTLHINSFDLKYYKTKTFTPVCIEPLNDDISGYLNRDDDDAEEKFEKYFSRYNEHDEYLRTHTKYVCSKWDKQNNNESFDFFINELFYWSLKYRKQKHYKHYKILGITGEGFETHLHIEYLLNEC